MIAAVIWLDGIVMANRNENSAAARVNRAWTEIETLVGTLDAKQLDSLAPPASDAQIDELSRSIGLNLPPDLKAHLKRHNGCLGDEVFIRFHFLSTQSIASRTRKNRKDQKTWLEENPGESLEFIDGGWNDLILAIGVSDAAGMELAVELPDCETTVPHLRAPINYAMPLARDFATYIESFAHHLRNGIYINEFGTLEFDHWAEWAVDADPNAR